MIFLLVSESVEIRRLPFQELHVSGVKIRAKLGTKSWKELQSTRNDRVSVTFVGYFSFRIASVDGGAI